MLRQIPVNQLKPDMILAEEIISPEGNLTLGQGTVITESWITRIANWGIASIKVKNENEMTGFNDNELERMLQSVLQPSKQHKDVRPAKTTISEMFFKGYNAVESQLCGIFLRTRCNGKVDIDGMEKLSVKVVDSILSIPDVLQFLHIPTRGENYMYRHALDVAVYAGLLARWLKCPKKDVVAVVFAGLLHDIGKAKVRFEIISKPSELNEEEHTMAQNHVQHGYKILTNNGNVPPKILLAVQQHHERMDGSGYPDGLQGEDITVFAKIIAIADVYDALTSDRYYRKAVTPLQAMDIMIHEMVGSFDVGMMNIFLTNICQKLLGEAVLLSNGVRGKIVSFSEYPHLKPTIELGDGKLLDFTSCADIRVKKIMFTESQK